MKISNKVLILSSQAISLVFSPFYLPVLAFVILFFFSYLNYMSWNYNLWVIIMVYSFTVLFPWLGITLYRKINGWTRHELGRKERRIIPYFISICSYSGLLWVMGELRMPRFTMALIVAALSIQIVCALVNTWMKVSTHAAASGGLIGSVMAFSGLFMFDPTWPLCFCFIINGIVCTARLILRQHTLSDLWVGTAIGILCGFYSIYLV